MSRGADLTGSAQTVPAISLWQPWASLVAIGAKQIETRHWSAPRRHWGQRIAIHAAKRKNDLWLCEEHPFSEYDLDAELPLGSLVATAVLARCTEINELAAAELQATRPHEYAFGNYDIGRWAWVLLHVEPLAEPVPWRGAQGFFSVPAETVGVVPAQGTLA